MALNPIREIILSISFTESIVLECIQRFTEIPEIKEAFPTIRPGYRANLNTAVDGNPPIPDVKKSGYVLKCDEPCNRILQAKVGLLAFHKTKEYESFEVLVHELVNYWEKFQTCTGPLHVTNVSVRYLNFIETNDQEEIKEYLNIWTEYPFNKVSNIFSSLRFKVENDQTTDATIVVTNGQDRDVNGLILDIILNRKIASEIFADISEAFDGLRAYKNNIFQKCITLKTKNKYNL